MTVAGAPAWVRLVDILAVTWVAAVVDTAYGYTSAKDGPGLAVAWILLLLRIFVLDRWLPKLD